MKKRGVTITIAAHVLGVSPSTLRLWTKNGKVVAEKARNGYRYYQIKDLVKIKESLNKKPRLTLRKKINLTK